MSRIDKMHVSVGGRDTDEKKIDTQAITAAADVISIQSYVAGIDDDVHPKQYVVPNNAAGILVTASSTPWELGAASATIITIPADTILCFLAVNIYGLDTNGQYQLDIIHSVTGTITSIPFEKKSVTADDYARLFIGGSYLCVPGTLTAKLACSAGTATGRVKLCYHYPLGHEPVVDPWVTAGTFVDVNTCYVYFSEEVDEATAETTTNYTFSGPSSPTCATATKISAQVVTLTTATAMISGAYTILVQNVEDLATNVVDAAHDEATVTCPAAPQVVGATVIDATTIDVEFDKAMDEALMEDEDHYAITGDDNIAVSAAVAQSSTVVRLTCATMANGNYSVGVIHVTDSVGLVVNSTYDDAAFVVNIVVYGWFAETLGTATTGNWSAVACDADGSFLIVCEHDKRIYTSSVGGGTWDARDPAAVGDHPWWAVASNSDGSFLMACGNSGRVYTSTNDGVDWTQRVNIGISAFYGVACSSTGASCAVVQYHVFVSTNYGVNFTETLPFGGHLDTFGIASDLTGDHLICCGLNDHVYTTVNQGTNWTERDPETVGHTTWRAVASNGDGTILLACDDTDGRVYLSTNSGGTWTAQSLAGVTTGDWRCLACSSDGQVMMAGNHDALMYVSTDGGDNWVAQTFPGSVTNEEWMGCAVSTDGKIRMACAGTDGRVYVYRVVV